MERTKNEKISIFRFGVIAPLIGVKKTKKGTKNKLIKEISDKEWEIPYSNRTYISCSTIKEWLKKYEESGNSLTSLEPIKRSDIGKSRRIDLETELAIIELRKKFPDISVTLFQAIAIERKIFDHRTKISKTTLYRIFKRNKLTIQNTNKKDLRKFEAELPNDLWQTDCMHGPNIKVENKMKKAYLFAIIDDNSRLITHAEFYLNEDLKNYLLCLEKALRKRGLPRKLYTDNGPLFRSNQLDHITASLGIALIHAKPYRPEGKGKIERWFRTIRTLFLPKLKEIETLESLNKKLWNWIESTYHERKHSSTSQTPFNKYFKHLELVRKAPENIQEYFRYKVKRKVMNDRAIYFKNKIFEAPVELIGKTVILLYHENDLLNIEVTYQNKSYGFLKELNIHINSNLIRNSYSDKAKNTENTNKKRLANGQLFDERSEK